jgi:hypothetical protein
MSLPWNRKDKNNKHLADEALADAEERLEDAFYRWPEVMGLQIEVARERQKNHFSERWERELRLMENARRR